MRMNENNYVGKIKEIISICGNGMDLHIRLVLLVNVFCARGVVYFKLKAPCYVPHPKGQL